MKGGGGEGWALFCQSGIGGDGMDSGGGGEKGVVPTNQYKQNINKISRTFCVLTAFGTPRAG